MSLSNISGSGSELSSRHIPDMDILSNSSNSSFSFQILGTATSDNLLTDEDGNDFFRNASGVDISLAPTHQLLFSPTHASRPPYVDERKDENGRTLGLPEAQSSTPAHITDLLTLSPGLAVDNLKHKSSNRRPKLSLNIMPIIQAVQTSPIAYVSAPLPESPIRTEGVQAKCNRFLQESEPTAVQASVQVSDIHGTNARPTKKKAGTKAGKQEDREKRLPRTQRKIVEGGIAKSRVAASKKDREVLLGAAAAPSTSPLELMRYSGPLQPVVPEDPGAALLDDSSSSSIIFPMTGIAGRLIQYGNKYTDTFNGQLDTKGPTKKPTLDSAIPPDPMASIARKMTQGQSEKHGSTFPVEGVADSLIQHRKRYTDAYCGQTISTETQTIHLSLQPKNASIQKSTPERSEEDAEDEDFEDDRTKPLTLSLLSPRKERVRYTTNPPITTLDSAPSCPKPIAKRPMAPEATSEERKLKRGKGDEPKTKHRPKKPTVSQERLHSKPRVPSAHSQFQSRKRGATFSGSNSSVTTIASKPAGIRRTRSRIVSAAKQAAVFNPGTGWNDDFRRIDVKGSNSSSKLSGSSLQNSQIQNDRKQDENEFAPSSSKANIRRVAEVTPEDPHSQSASRSQSNSRLHKHKFYHPAPDFKAIHAAFDASIAQRKENINPTVPLPMRWETESRIQERKKFDQRLREKEREKEREEEERRRFREAEEEQELKELRKKMVVKAHEVPEWYNARPKTKKRQEQDVEN